MTGRGLAFAGAALLALAASLGIHLGAGAIGPSAEPAVEIAGGETMQAAALGSGFESLVAAGDRLSPVDAETEAVAPAENAGVEPVDAVASEAAGEPDTPLPTEPAPATDQAVAVPSAEATQSPSQATPTDAASPVPGAVPTISTPAAVADPVAAPNVSAVQPPATQAPEVAAVAPVRTSDVVEARPDEPVLPIPQARPFRQIDVDRARAEQQRRAARAERQRQAEQQRQAERQRAAERQRRAQEQQRTTRQQARGAEQGQADRNAQAGRADGQAQGRSANARQGNERARQAGNAAASNYPGKVYAKIRRTRQRSAGGRGTVRVSFSIAGNGGLAGISVAASSGTAAVDRAAVDHIRRAAPFPAPPPGAQTQFVIPIEIRR